MKMIDLTGRIFGRLTVIDRAPNQNTRVVWNCLCECGEKKAVQSNNLINKSSKSCGCLFLERVKVFNIKHGHKVQGRITKEYHAWRNLKERCLNTKNKAYKHYGGRGIKVCDSWLNNFEQFYIDMGNAPTTEHSIDRIDNNGNYEPTNCRWATQKEQRSNTRSNVLLTHKGLTLTVAEWAERIGKSRYTLYHRVKSGWTTEQILKEYTEATHED